MTVIKEAQYVALQQLTRTRYNIVHQMTREKQRFLQYLSYKCNTFTEDVESTSSVKVLDRKSTRLNSSHVAISYAVFCLKKKSKYVCHFITINPTHCYIN